jgi:hypothetical protein
MAEPIKNIEHVDFSNYYATKADVVQSSSDLKDAIRALDSKTDTNKSELKQELGNLRSELKQDINNLRSELKEELHALKYAILESNKATDNKFKNLIIIALGSFLTSIAIPVSILVFSKKFGLA